MDPSDLDALYAAPLRDFVQNRNDLAKQTRLAGDRDRAKEIKALEKPTLPAWSLNQLVRQHREDVERLFLAIDDVRRAQLGDPDDPDRLDLTAAMGNERAAMQNIERQLEALLSSAGHATSRSTIDRALRSVRASAVAPARREILLAGCLTTDVEDDGFAGLAAQLGGGFVPPAAPRAKPASTVIAEPEPKPAPQKTEPPIDLGVERRRRAALEQEKKERARQETLRAKHVAIRASVMVEQKLAKELETAEREVSEAKRRLTVSEETLTNAQAKLRVTVKAREALEREVAELEGEPS